MDNELFLKIFEIVLTVGTALVVRYFIPWLKSQSYYNNLEYAISVAETFVVYAEKVISGSKKGEEKFQLVVDFIAPVLKNIGVKYTDDQIKSIIQSAYENVIGSPETKEVE